MKRKKYCTLIKSTTPCPLLTIVFTIIPARDSRRKKMKCVHSAKDEEENWKTSYLIKPFFSFFMVLFQQHQFLFSIISSAFHPFKLNKKLKIYSNKQTKRSSDSAIHQQLTSAVTLESENFESLFTCASSFCRCFFSLSMLSERWVSFPSNRLAFSSAEAAEDSAFFRRFISLWSFTYRRIA